ncbi:putative metal-binding motif-containing protein [Candidatus Micrarchaeota archaeon]|nr:putative metal-binding motif-containing protein [Candidatus Micrarchaeota archaeon]
MVFANVGIKTTQKVVGGVANLVFELAEYCETKELREWKDYYKGLCYGEDDKFEIWKWKETDTELELPAGIKAEWIANPFIIIIPKKPPANWTPSSAQVKGSVKTPKFLPSSFVFAEPVDDSLPLIFKSPVYNNQKKAYDYSFLISTCPGINTAHRIKASSVLGLCSAKSPDLNLQTGEIYTVDFELGSYEACLLGKFKPYSPDKDDDNYGDKYKLTITSSPSKDSKSTSSDCNDSDETINPAAKEICGDKKDNNCNGQVDYGCTGFELLNSVEFNSICCPVLDAEGNVYLFDVPSDSADAIYYLRSYNSNLELRWEMQFPIFSERLVSSGNTLYVIGSNEVYAVGTEGNFMWKTTVPIYGYGSSFTDGSDLYITGNWSKIYKLAGTSGEFKALNTPSMMAISNLTSDGNLIYLTWMGYPAALEKSGAKVWADLNYKNPIGTIPHSFILGTDSLLFASHDEVVSVSKNGDLNWKYDGESNLKVSFSGQIVTDEFGNVYVASLSDYGAKPAIHSFDSKGNLRWSVDGSQFVSDSYLPKSSGNLSALKGANLFINYNDRLLVLDTNDPEVKSLQPAREFHAFHCPFLGTSDGRMFNVEYAYPPIGGGTVFLEVFQTPYTLSNSSWPMQGHDPQNTNNASTPIK